MAKKYFLKNLYLKMKACSISQKELAKAAGIEQSCFSRRLNCDYDKGGHFSELQKDRICEALGVKTKKGRKELFEEFEI